jgi:hypothetical protein
LRTPTFKDKEEEKKKRSLKNNQASIEMEQEIYKLCQIQRTIQKLINAWRFANKPILPVNVTS